MRVVSYGEFCSLPEGTLYCRLHAGIFGEFEIKRSMVANGDWMFQALSPIYFEPDEEEGSYFTTLDRSLKEKAELKLDFDYFHTNSDYDDFHGMTAASGKYTFAIFTNEEIMSMMGRLAFAAGR